MIRVQLHQPKREGTWVLRWYTSDGSRRIAETIGDATGPDRLTPAKAEKIRKAKELAINKGEIARDKPRRMTLESFAEWHAEIVRAEVRDTTAAEYGFAFKWASRIIGGGTTIEAVNAQHAARIRNAMTDAGKSAATVKKTLAHLRGAWTRAVKHRLATCNPFIGMVGGGSDAKAARIFTRAEIESLSATAPDSWWRAFIRLGFTSGLRRDEMLMLRWRDVDFEAGTVTVTARKVESIEVDGVAVPTLAWQAKAASSYRTVPIPEATVQALADLLDSSDGSPYLFLTLDRLRVIQATMAAGKWRPHSTLVNNLLRNWQAVQRKALGKAAVLGSIHDMRKTYGTLTAQAVPMHVLKDLMGHSTINTTATFYAKVQASDADRVRALWASNPATTPQPEPAQAGETDEA